MTIDPDSLDFLKCDRIIRIELKLVDTRFVFQSQPELVIWVEYETKMLELRFGGLKKLALPIVYGSIAFGELAIISRKSDGLEGIRFEASDELVGIHILAGSLSIDEIA